jgi:prepilin-type N-terminal cleavage/methylation domain-containing protein
MHMNVQTRPVRPGFTLIELLVVVSIIIILISILAPSLLTAVEMTHNTICLRHIGLTARDLSNYCSANGMWLPGPNTSGYELTRGATLDMDAELPADQPVQNMDWISPTLGSTGALEGKFQDRVKGIFNSRLRCPSNEVYFDDQEGSPTIPGDITEIQYPSYSAALGFHVLGTSVPDGPVPDFDYDDDGHDDHPSYRTPSSWQAQIRITDSDQASDWIEPSPYYRPRYDMIGGTDSKIFAMEGARIVSVSAAYTVHFNPERRDDKGGNYMVYGPATGITGGPFWNDGTNEDFHDKYNELVYRHTVEKVDGLGKMNVVTFGGGVESLTRKASLDIHRYFPTGFTIKSVPNKVSGEGGYSISSGSKIMDSYVAP